MFPYIYNADITTFLNICNNNVSIYIYTHTHTHNADSGALYARVPGGNSVDCMSHPGGSGCPGKH